MVVTLQVGPRRRDRLKDRSSRIHTLHIALAAGISNVATAQEYAEYKFRCGSREMRRETIIRRVMTVTFPRLKVAPSDTHNRSVVYFSRHIRRLRDSLPSSSA
jgi:hypothetical protein